MPALKLVKVFALIAQGSATMSDDVKCLSNSLLIDCIMKIIALTSIKFLISLIVVTVFASYSYGDIVLDSGNISVMQASGGGFLAGTSTFNLNGVDPLDVELLADFNIVDAGVDIRVNGTSLFPLFDDISQFSQDLVFLNTGVTRTSGDMGNVESPFSPNNNGLPRLTVESTSDGTVFSGGALLNSTSTVEYTPNFAVVDFSSLLNSGDNTIEFFVLNSFEGANLQGDFAVTQIVATTAVPEPSSTGLMLLGASSYLLRRRRR